ncbi:Hypothetical predicted protein [Pelobates cultripes]|uniref:Uncharacterized protein n=1 Tax=Pelobates cultripes TaxID=61616 RepID=A0AAD1R3L4_PELCU|nr:Hypothetical predicted protein [Pelobates cultripes]
MGVIPAPTATPPEADLKPSGESRFPRKGQHKGNGVVGSCEEHQLHIAQTPKVKGCAPLRLQLFRPDQETHASSYQRHCQRSASTARGTHGAPTLLGAEARRSVAPSTHEQQAAGQLRLTHHAQESGSLKERGKELVLMAYSRHRVKQSGDINTLRVPPLSTQQGVPNSSNMFQD